MRHIGQGSRSDRYRRVGKMGGELLARAVVAGRNHDVGEYFPLLPFGRKPFQRFQKYVYAFVVEFVTTARSHNQRFAVECMTEAGFGYRNQEPARFGPLAVEHGALPDEIVFETVGSDLVRFPAEQVPAFAGRDVADRTEAVVVGSGNFLERVFGNYIELTGEVVRIQVGQLSVQWDAVAGNASPYDRGVRREDRGGVRSVLPQVETAAGGHPFMEMRYRHFVGGTEHVAVTLDDLACGIAEQHGFDIIPLAAYRIDLVTLPESFQNVVLFVEERAEIHQYGDGAPIDVPSSYPDTYAFAVNHLLPFGKQAGILFEFRIVVLAVDIRTNGYVAVPECFYHRLCLGGHYRMYPAHLVAYLPAHLEKAVGPYQGFVVLIFHSYFFVIYFYCRPCNGCAVYRLISVSAKQHPSEY